MDAGPTAIPLLVPSGPVARADHRPGRAAGLGRPAGGRPGGPVALDAERASGFRYGSRAYLVQLRRPDLGTALLDPIPLRRPERAGRAAGRLGVGAARREPGPALPGRDRASGRAGCSTPNWPADWPACRGSGSARWSSRCSGCTCARGTAPPTGRRGRCRTTGWSTPHWTSRCWSSCATRWRHELGPAGQARVGPAGVRGHRRRTARPAAGRPVAPDLRHAPDQRPARAGGHPRAVDRPGTRSPAAGTSPRTGSCPTRRSSRRPPPGRPSIAALIALPVFSGRMQRRNADLLAGRDQPGAGAAGRRPAGRPAARGRPTRARRSGRPGTRPPRPGCRRPGSAWPSCPNGSARRWRTCCPPTPCAGCCGARRTAMPASRSPSALAERGARPWQIELTAPVLRAALDAAVVEPSYPPVAFGGSDGRRWLVDRPTVAAVRRQSTSCARHWIASATSASTAMRTSCSIHSSCTGTRRGSTSVVSAARTQQQPRNRPHRPAPPARRAPCATWSSSRACAPRSARPATRVSTRRPGPTTWSSR